MRIKLIIKALGFAVLLTILVELIVFNYPVILSKLKLYPQEKSVYLNNLNIKDFCVNTNGTLTSTSNDPWLELKNINANIKTLGEVIDYQGDITQTTQVYYTTTESPSYSEANSVVQKVNDKQKLYVFTLKSAQQIKDLRFDLTNVKGATLRVRSILLNPAPIMRLSPIRMVKLFFLFSIFMLLLKFIFYAGFENALDLVTKKRYFIALILFVLLVVFKINGSSIGIWNDILGTKSTVVMGETRGIRSDEWLVHTPWIVGQSAVNYSTTNPNILSNGQNMLLADVPTLDLSLIVKPYFWGFIVLGSGYGMAWYWAFKLLMLILLSYEVAMYLSGGHKFLSIVGALWIGLSPPVQWWFDTPAAVVELLIYAEGMIVSAIYFVKNSYNPQKRILFIILMTVSIMGYISELFPEIQVSLGLLTLIFIFSIIYPEVKKHRLFFCKAEKVTMIVSLILITLYSAWIISVSLDQIKIMLDTVYPGGRVSTGGSYNPYWLQLFLISWMLPFRDVPPSLWNNSEASQFMNFLPALLLSFFLVYNEETEKKMLVTGLFGYLMFEITWLFVKFPEPLAKLTLFSFVPERRFGNIIVGLTIVYLNIWLIPHLVKRKKFSVVTGVFASFLIAIIYYISLFNTPMGQYLTPILAFFTVVYFVVLNFLLLRGHAKAFLTMSLIFIIVSGSFVNPINQGVGSLHDGKLLKVVQQIESEDPNSKWATNDSLVYSQLLIANGILLFNSVQFYPDLFMWNKLDPTHQYNQVYNRYAHVMLKLTTQNTYFKLVQADVIELYLNVNDINKTDIKYILSQQDLHQFEPVVKEIYQDSTKSVYIYKVTK